MTTATPTERKTTVPWVTLSLIALSLVAYFLVSVSSDLGVDLAFDPSHPSFARAVLSLFLHANIFHLLGNMVFLAAVGPRVEEVAGRWPYLTIYFVGGLTGVAAHWAIMRAIGSPAPLLGASGAIASCAGYCAVRFLNRRVPLAPKLTVTVGTVTLVWVSLQALGSFVRFGGALGGTAYWTHLAGFFTGLLLSLLFRAPRQARIQQGHEFLDQMVERSPGAMLQAAEKHLEEHPDDIRALRSKASALHQMGEKEQEADVLASLLELVEGESQAQVVHELAECGGLDRLSGVRRLRLGESLAGEYGPLAVQVLASVIADDSASAQRPDALLALAQLVGEPKSKELLDELERDFALHSATEMARSKGLIR
jgi:membrane associated rhomboid family serine protease